MSSAPARYMRYLLFAGFTIAVLFFISRSSIPLPDTANLPSKLNPSKSKPNTQDSPQPPANAPADNSLHEKPQYTPAGAGAHPDRVNATFVTLARNSDVWEIAESIRQVEDRFNRNYNYDWVFLNDKDFDDEFKKVTTSLVSGKTHYGLIPHEHWSYPEWIDQSKASQVRQDMGQRKIIYGDSESYRHMCRYESGFFYRHELMQPYEFYWRVEPSIKLFCDVSFDPFRYMKEHDKKYGFVISLYEYYDTIPSLWDTVKEFMEKHPEHVAEDNAMDFLSDDGGKTYNKCHFWSNFEIGSLDWLRSDAYRDYFDHLDHQGGFFYERWGDAPVHSIAAGTLLKKEQVHFFNEIAYYHVPFTHCPTGEDKRLSLKCHCDPGENFDWKGYSCTSRWFHVNNMEKPKGYEEEMN